MGNLLFTVWIGGGLMLLLFLRRRYELSGSGGAADASVSALGS